MKKTIGILTLLIAFFLTGCSLSESAGVPSPSTEDGELTASPEYLKSLHLATYDYQKYIFFEDNTLVVETVSEKANSATDENAPLSREEAIDTIRYTNVKIETKGDTYHITGEDRFEMTLRMLSTSVFEDSEGQRYMVQTN